MVSFVCVAKVAPNHILKNSLLKIALKYFVYELTYFSTVIDRVSERPSTRMSIDNLAKVFGPTVVGYSVPNPQPTQMISETQPQQDVMTSLLEHNTDYWTDILSGNYSEIGSAEYDFSDSPDMRPHTSMFYLFSFFVSFAVIFAYKCL